MTEKSAASEPRHVTIRQRVSLAMILLVLIVLLVTGSLVFVLEDRSVRQRVMDGMQRNKEEFAVLALDVLTGQVG